MFRAILGPKGQNVSKVTQVDKDSDIAIIELTRRSRQRSSILVAHNPKAVGSNPAPATNFLLRFFELITKTMKTLEASNGLNLILSPKTVTSGHVKSLWMAAKLAATWLPAKWLGCQRYKVGFLRYNQHLFSQRGRESPFLFSKLLVF